MMGAGATVPGYSAHDQALTMLKVASDAKGTKERLDALEAGKKSHDNAKAAAEKATSEALKAATALSKKEQDLAAREERLKTDTDAHHRNREQAEALHEDRAASLAERAAALDKERKEHSEKVNEFSRYREREIAAIQAKAVQANKVMEAANAELKGVEQQKAVLEAKLANIENWKAHIGESLKGL